MSTLTTTATVGGILPEQYGALIVKPVQDAALAFNPAVSTTIQTASTEFHVPVVSADGGAAWTQEGEEISPDDTVFEEIVVVPKKVAGLRIISSELANDSSPAAQAIVGQSLARAIATQVDTAFFGNTTANGPSGLLSLATTSGKVQKVNAGTAFDSLDAFAEAISLAETAGATVTAFVANPADALVLAQLKDETGSARPLLGIDATNGTARQALGVPLLVSSKVAAGVVWALDASKNLVVLRNDVQLSVSDDAYFSSDRVGVRAVLRLGFGFPQLNAVVKIAYTSGT